MTNKEGVHFQMSRRIHNLFKSSLVGMLKILFSVVFPKTVFQNPTKLLNKPIFKGHVLTTHDPCFVLGNVRFIQRSILRLHQADCNVFVCSCDVIPSVFLIKTLYSLSFFFFRCSFEFNTLGYPLC